MRIPKRVNAAWDWAEGHKRATAFVALLLAVSVGTLWALPLATFALGLAIGGLLVHRRLTARIERLRGERDDVLRENGRLRHRATVLASGVVEAEALMTQQLITIPEESERATLLTKPAKPEPAAEPAPAPDGTMELPDLSELTGEDGWPEAYDHRKSA